MVNKTLNRYQYPNTPLSGLGPLRPIVCPICGKQLGSWWRLRETWYSYAEPCSDRCEELKAYARGDLAHSKPLARPKDWRQSGNLAGVHLATGYLEWRLKENG